MMTAESEAWKVMVSMYELGLPSESWNDTLAAVLDEMQQRALQQWETNVQTWLADWQMTGNMLTASRGWRPVLPGLPPPRGCPSDVTYEVHTGRPAWTTQANVPRGRFDKKTIHFMQHKHDTPMDRCQSSKSSHGQETPNAT